MRCVIMANTIVMTLFGIVLAALIIFQCYSSNKEEKKQMEQARINKIHKYVTDGFDEVIKEAERFGDKFSSSLNDYADKMYKLSQLEVKKDLKPYDEYEAKFIYSPSSEIIGRIVIDKNLTPKFMVTYPSIDREEADIQLEVALTLDMVTNLASRCIKAKMDSDIETFRLKKVDKIING